MDRYDIPKSEIQNTGRNVLIGLPLYGIVHKYKVRREEEPLPIKHNMYSLPILVMDWNTDTILSNVYLDLEPVKASC